jgi:hypothetical protein
MRTAFPNGKLFAKVVCQSEFTAASAWQARLTELAIKDRQDTWRAN